MSSGHGPQRIVSLQPSATLILRDLNKLDLLVGCTKYCLEACPEIADRGTVIVSDSWTADAEQIRALRPDLVIASVPYQEKSVAEILRANTPLLALAPKKLSDIYSDIAMIAGVVGEAETGEAIIARMKNEIETIRRHTATMPRPKVFCEEWPKPLIASQLWVAELVEAAGGEFIGTPGKQTSFAQIAAADPDVIVAAWCGARDRVPLEKTMSTRGWGNLKAAVNGRVYCVADEYLNTPAPTLIHGLHALAAAIHPEAFPQAQGLRCINSAMHPPASADRGR